MNIDGKSYSVNFQVNVSVGKKPGLFSRIWNALFGTKNYVKANSNSDFTQSNVRMGFLGEWRTNGRGGLSLSNDNPAGHEYGHMLGFMDRYDKTTFSPNEGWEGNIMAEPAMRGHVDQYNINALGNYITGKGGSSGTIRHWKMKY
jgi:hypothetical protein